MSRYRLDPPVSFGFRESPLGRPREDLLGKTNSGPLNKRAHVRRLRSVVIHIWFRSWRVATGGYANRPRHGHDCRRPMRVIIPKHVFLEPVFDVSNSVNCVPSLLICCCPAMFPPVRDTQAWVRMSPKRFLAVLYESNVVGVRISVQDSLVCVFEVVVKAS